MAEQVLKMRIQFRRDTTANWELYKDVVPAAGEPCFDLNLGTLKIGDGVKTYEQLEAIGGSGSVAVSADGTSIILSNGVFKLAGFDTAATGAQPRKNVDGELEWVVPSSETLDGLQTIVAGLQTDVSDLQTDVSAIQEILTPSAEGEEPLLTRIEALEGNVETLNGDENTDGSVLKIVKDEINSFATNVSNDGVVNSYKELIDYVANHGGEVATMAADITALQSAVEKKVNAETGKSLVSDTLIAKLEAIEEGAQANKIESIKLGDNTLEIVDKTVTVSVGAGLQASDEVTIAGDGTLGIGQIGISKLVQESDVVLVLNGGSANQ